MEGASGKKRHLCEVCGKYFNRRAELERHIRVHTGIKPFSCDICHKNFSLEFNLKKHLRIHDKDQPEQVAEANQTPSNDGPPDGVFLHPSDKEEYSDDELIGMALRNNPKMKCTVEEICQFIIDYFQGYKRGESKTKLLNSIRGHLDNSPRFVKAGLEFKFGGNGVHRQNYYTFRPVNDIIQEYEENCSIFI